MNGAMRFLAEAMQRSIDAPLQRRAGFAVLAAGCGALARFILPAGLADPYLLFYPTVLVAALFGGLLPGCLALALLAAVEFTLSEVAGRPLEFALFIVGALAVATIAEALRRALAIERGEEAKQERSIEMLLREKARLGEQLSGIASAAPGVIYSCRRSPDGAFSFPYVSTNSRAVLGVSPADFLDNSAAPFKLVHPDDVAALMASVAASASGMSLWQHEFRFLHPDRGEIWVEGHSSPVRTADGAIIWHGYIQDVTARRQDQERIRVLHESRLNAMKTIASGLAHEISQPLTAAVAFIRTVRRLIDAPPDKRPITIPEGLDKAAAQISRAGAIVARLRDFIAHGEPHKTLFPLHQLIEETARTLLSGAREPKVAIAFRFEAADDSVFADRIQIGQVLSNVMRNAMDAVEKAEKRELLVATRSEADQITVDVHDSGAGLPDEVMDKLFAPFVSTKLTGMGVGLSISRVIVQAHDGSMSAIRNEKGGATISFTLPRASSAV